MTPGEVRRFERVEAAFHAALERSEGEERERFFAAACAADPEIGLELGQLLASDSQVQGAATAPIVGLPRFGAWQASRRLGSGGMGTVYLAERADGAFQMQAAVKVVPLALASREIEERFRRERQILAVLDHPGIARLIDGGVSDTGLPFLVMEFVDGKAIDRHATDSSLDIRARVSLMLQVLEALKCVHSRRVLHRDLKPSNVLVDSLGRVRLLDFGIARLMQVESEQALTRSGVLTFTPDYASPEQVRGEELTEASDLYSAGVLLSKLLTGRHPVADASAFEGMDANIAFVIRKAVNEVPSARYAAASDMAADLERYLAGRTTAARLDKRRKSAGFAGILCMALAVPGSLYLCYRASQRDVALLETSRISSPALTPDGKWIAYAFQSHIWLRQTGEKTPHQVTFQPGNDLHPALSPDGETLIYEHHGDAAHPATAILYKLRLKAGRPGTGEERLDAGYKPKISPDSTKLAFETALVTGADDAIPRHIQVISLTGERSRVELKQPPALSDWVWMSDSRGLLAIGNKSAQNSSGPDREQFFQMDLQGGEPKLLEYWRSEYAGPMLCGTRYDSAAAIATIGKDRQWVELSPSTGSVRVVRRQLPEIAGCELLTDGRMAVFPDSSERTAWEIRGDVAHGRFPGDSLRATGIHPNTSISASEDNRWLAWFSRDQVELHDALGRTLKLPAATTAAPYLSRDDQTLVVKAPHWESLYWLFSLPGLKATGKFDLDAVIWSVSRNARWALCLGTPRYPRSIAALETASGVIHTLLADTRHDLYLASFSPDERWIVFTASETNAGSKIYVARFDASRLISSAEWIEIADGNYPTWAPSGDRIYFLAPNGHRILSLALDPATKRPLIRSQPRIACEFPASWGMTGLLPGTFRIAVTRDRLLFVLASPRLSIQRLGQIGTF